MTRGTHGCFRVLPSVNTPFLHDLLALLGRKHSVGSVFELISNILAVMMNMMAGVMNHLSSGLEDGGHGERVRGNAVRANSIVNRQLMGGMGWYGMVWWGKGGSVSIYTSRDALALGLSCN